MKNKQLINHLQQLLDVTNDSITVYKKAVAYARDREVRQLFSKGLVRHINYSRELKNEIKAAGGKAKDSRTLFGMITKIWADIKTTISTDQERTMLEDINGHEKYVIDVYYEMLKPNWLPLHLRQLLKKQLFGIKLVSTETEQANWVFI